MKKLKAAGTVLLAVLLGLLFLSKTIYTYNIPVVTAASPANGRLNKLEYVSGVTDWAETEEVYAPLGGEVAQIYAAEGERVLAGQPLLAIRYDTDSVQKKLQEWEVSREKLLLELESIQRRRQKAVQNRDDLSGEVYEPETVSDFTLRQRGQELAKIQAEYDIKAQLYELGEISRQELDTAAYNLQSGKNQYADAEKSLAENQKKAEEAAAEQEKNRAKQLREYQYELDALRQEEASKNLDLENLALQQQEYEDMLADYEANQIIYAGQDATIVSLSVKKGQFMNERQHIATLGVGDGFVLECPVSLDNNFIAVGDVYRIVNATHSFDAAVTKITPLETAKKITLSVRDPSLSHGETFEARFEKTSAQTFILAPNAAVNQDSEGYFLYQLKRRDGILGKEYYADKLRVYIGDSDADNTVIAKGVTFFEPVVVLSDKAFAQGDTVRIQNEGDFFAD